MCISRSGIAQTDLEYFDKWSESLNDAFFRMDKG